jgi:hypothetical protein
MMTPQTMATNGMHDPVSPLSTYDDSEVYLVGRDGIFNGCNSQIEADKETTMVVVGSETDQTTQKLPTQDPGLPLCTYDDMAAKDGVLDGGNSPAEAAEDTTVAEVANSDTGSQKLPTQGDLPLLDEQAACCATDSLDSPGFEDGNGQDGESFARPVIHEAAQGPNDPAAQSENITEQNHKPANDHLGYADYRAEEAVSDSGSRIPPKLDPASSSVKGTQSTKRRTKATIDPDDLPSKDDELSEAQIASLCYQPPRVRQAYTRYFANAGTIRAAYANILMERLPNGELRFPEDVLRSCLPKWKGWKDRLGSSQPGDSAQTGSGPNRKRKGAATPAKRFADEDIEPPKKTKKPNVSKNEKSKEPPPDLDSNYLNLRSSLEPRHQSLRFVSVITPGTALSRGLPPSAISSKPPTAPQAGSSESFPSEASKTPYSQQPKVQNQPSQIAASNINPSAVPNLDEPRVHNHGNCQLLDPNHLSQFAQYLTGQIQQLDLAIVSIAHGAHDQGRRYALRRLRDVLIDLRDLCVDMEIEQRSRTVTKSRDNMDDL